MPESFASSCKSLNVKRLDRQQKRKFVSCYRVPDRSPFSQIDFCFLGPCRYNFCVCKTEIGGKPMLLFPSGSDALVEAKLELAGGFFRASCCLQEKNVRFDCSMCGTFYFCG